MEELKKRIVIGLFGLIGLSPLALVGADMPALSPTAEQPVLVLPKMARGIPAAPGGVAILPVFKRIARRQLKIFASRLCIDFAGRPLARSFRDAQGELELTFEHRSDRDAIEQVIGGDADLALVSVELSDFERNYGIEERVFAYLLPTLVVHANNPVGNLQREDVWKLLSGKMNSWAELGGQSADLHGYLTGPTSLVQSQELTMMPGHEFSADWPMLSAAQVRARVASDLQALGVTHLAGTNSDLRTLAIDGVFPSVHSFLDGRYPFGHGFRVVFLSEKEADVEIFLRFLGSDAARDCLAGGLILPE